MSGWVNFRNKLEGFFDNGLAKAEAFLKPVAEEILPFAEADLKAALEAGATAAASTFEAGPAAMTLSATEAALIAGARAAVSNAAAAGKTLTVQSATALIAAAGLHPAQ